MIQLEMKHTSSPGWLVLICIRRVASPSLRWSNLLFQNSTTVKARSEFSVYRWYVRVSLGSRRLPWESMANPCMLHLDKWSYGYFWPWLWPSNSNLLIKEVKHSHNLIGNKQAKVIPLCYLLPGCGKTTAERMTNYAAPMNLPKEPRWSETISIYTSWTSAMQQVSWKMQWCNSARDQGR